MAGIESIAALLGVASGVAGMVQQARTAQVDSQRLTAQANANVAAAAREQDEIARERAETERARRAALRRAIASQRAKLGAQGISSSEGSGEALLLGLVNDSALDAAEAEDERRAALTRIREELAGQQTLSLLDQERLSLRQPTAAEQLETSFSLGRSLIY